MPIQREKAEKIQELLKKLATSGTFESVAITKEIQEVATENREQPEVEQSKPEPALQH